MQFTKPATLYPKDTDSKTSSRASSPAKLTPMQTLEQIRRQLEELNVKVEQFSSNKNEREYKLLEELLTQLLLKLDLVDSEGVEQIKTERRVLVRDVQAVLDHLELKAYANEQPSSFVLAHTTAIINNSSNNSNSNEQSSDCISAANQLNVSTASSDNSSAPVQLNESNNTFETAHTSETVHDLVLDSEMSC